MFLGRKNQYCEMTSYQIQSKIQCNPYQIPSAIFTEVGQKISQQIWKHKIPQTAKAVFRKKNGAGVIHLLDLRLYYKATVIKTAWYWHKDRNVEQRNKIESPEINP